jgi:hypothetical protein
MSNLSTLDLPVTDDRRYSRSTRAGQRVRPAQPFTVMIRYAGSTLDRIVYRASRGRITLAGPSLPTMLLTTRDRNTGKRTTVPACYMRDGHNLLSAGVNTELPTPAGRPGYPFATIQIGSTIASYRTRPATAQEIDRAMPRLQSTRPAHRSQPQRTDTRHVFVFEPLYRSLHERPARGTESLPPKLATYAG